MKMTHKEYLENMLYTKKLQLREEEVQNRIHIAENAIRYEFLNNAIESIEKQLKEHEEKNRLEGEQ